ncbi:hypothetical protein [Rhizobium sp. HT1-10]|uniref:hypothetical protein n=1 Tax=Rhizobium sp. HT1-10 TaxID=3111638 RepID=UPI003C142A1A
MPDIDLDTIARQNAEILEALCALRTEFADLNVDAGQTLDITRRNDPRRPTGMNR